MVPGILQEGTIIELFQSKKLIFFSPYIFYTGFFLVPISPYSVQILENTDQEKLRIWTLFTQ